MPIEHHSVNRSISEYPRGMARTNCMESFWPMFKHRYISVYRRMSAKHLDRRVAKLGGHHDTRSIDTTDQIGGLLRRTNGIQLRHNDLTAPISRLSGAQA